MALAMIPAWMTPKHHKIVLALYRLDAMPGARNAQGLRAIDFAPGLRLGTIRALSPTVISVVPGPSKCWLGADVTPDEAAARRRHAYVLTPYGATVARMLADQPAHVR